MFIRPLLGSGSPGPTATGRSFETAWRLGTTSALVRMGVGVVATTAAAAAGVAVLEISAEHFFSLLLSSPSAADSSLSSPGIIGKGILAGSNFPPFSFSPLPPDACLEFFFE